MKRLKNLKAANDALNMEYEELSNNSVSREHFNEERIRHRVMQGVRAQRRRRGLPNVYNPHHSLGLDSTLDMKKLVKKYIRPTNFKGHPDDIERSIQSVADVFDISGPVSKLFDKFRTNIADEYMEALGKYFFERHQAVDRTHVKLHRLYKDVIDRHFRKNKGSRALSNPTKVQKVVNTLKAKVQRMSLSNPTVVIFSQKLRRLGKLGHTKMHESIHRDFQYLLNEIDKVEKARSYYTSQWNTIRHSVHKFVQFHIAETILKKGGFGAELVKLFMLIQAKLVMDVNNPVSRRLGLDVSYYTSKDFMIGLRSMHRKIVNELKTTEFENYFLVPSHKGFQKTYDEAVKKNDYLEHLFSDISKLFNEILKEASIEPTLSTNAWHPNSADALKLLNKPNKYRGSILEIRKIRKASLAKGKKSKSKKRKGKSRKKRT